MRKECLQDSFFEVRLKSDIEQANFHTYQLRQDEQIFLSLLLFQANSFLCVELFLCFGCGIDYGHLSPPGKVEKCNI